MPNQLYLSMKTPFISILLTLFLSTTLLLTAGDKDTIGLTDLLAREPGVNGTGLRIALVEASTSLTSEKYQPNPASADPAITFSFFDSASTYPTAGVYNGAKYSSHANTVANHYFDLNTGVATDVSEIYVFNANNFFNEIIQTNTNISAKVINQSFVFSEVNTAIDQLYDNYAHNYQTLFVNGLNNTTSSTVRSPYTSYNCIAVGREDLNHSSGPADNRSKPDIIAPGSYTSFATPYVSGSAAILIEAALTLEHGGIGTANTASDIRTIKALLLNGAVKDSAWSHTDTHPLDTRRGAGLLNINHSHLQLQGGKHSPTASANLAPSSDPTPSSSQVGAVASPIGWNFSTITNPRVQGQYKDRVDNYYFDIPVGIVEDDITATLVWHRQAGKTTINNLDLILYNANTGSVLEQSISTVDNVEHIHTRNLPAGRYVLQVIKRNSGRVSTSEDYALAFNLPIPPNAPSALSATAQPDSEIVLTWTDNSTDEDNFELERSTLSGSAFSTIATLVGGTISHTDTAPLENTTYYYRVKATNAIGDSLYSNVASATTFSKLMNWRQDNFASSDDTGDSANTADPDKDGVNNITEYALGKDPNSAAGTNGGSALPKASIVNDGGIDYLQITVTRVANKTDLNYIIQVSGDLLPGWTETNNILEDTATTLRVRDNIAVSGNNRRFIRLKITEK